MLDRRIPRLLSYWSVTFSSFSPFRSMFIELYSNERSYHSITFLGSWFNYRMEINCRTMGMYYYLHLKLRETSFWFWSGQYWAHKTEWFNKYWLYVLVVYWSNHVSKKNIKIHLTLFYSAFFYSICSLIRLKSNSPWKSN